ncbi:unnamed protein product [Phytophthora fragariaefolia]|uniref:Unnamed protein product n=1 Tax=Phytophthora fragariaefolia TaxID=1490495 RepID=A0A9W6WTJ4_9STRA|nr:unnamed protein product [Phytophthora fragariaefolia]
MNNRPHLSTEDQDTIAVAATVASTEVQDSEAGGPLQAPTSRTMSGDNSGASNKRLKPWTAVARAPPLAARTAATMHSLGFIETLFLNGGRSSQAENGDLIVSLLAAWSRSTKTIDLTAGQSRSSQMVAISSETIETQDDRSRP